MIRSHPQWENILDSYFKSNGFVKQQIESYNEFVEYDIQRIIDETGPIEIHTSPTSRGGEMHYTITFGKISVKKPVIRENDGTTNVLYPQEARNRSLTYHSALYCDITVKTVKISTGEETVNVSKEQLGFIPIMVHSKFCLLNTKKTEKQLMDLNECIYDEGGYFIVSGNEKVVVAQERMPFNETFCFYKKPPSKIIWQAEIRSQFEYHIKATSTLYVKLFSKGTRMSNHTPTFTDIDGLRVQITYIKQDIPILFVFYALGFTDEDILGIINESCIIKNNEYAKNILKFMRCSFDEAKRILNNEQYELDMNESDQSDSEHSDIEPETKEVSTQGLSELQIFALDYIGKKGSMVFNLKEERVKYAIGIINKELFPHLHTEFRSIYENTLQLVKTKALYLSYIINKLYLCYIHKISENDRDHLANKRMELTGNLMANLFKTIFKRVHKEAKVILTKSIESNNTFDLVNAIKSKSITNDIKYALSTGNWGRQTNGTAPKMGVAQQLSRLTYSSTLSHLRRMNTPLNREGKQAKPRQLHGTHYGYMCPSETPEGQGCGLLKNMAITCHISIGSKQTFELLIDYIKKHYSSGVIEHFDFEGNQQFFKVFIDGMWIVSVDEQSIKKINETFVGFRRNLIIHYDTSICLDNERKELNIYTCSGRCCRPLLVVENLHKLKEKMEWTELLLNGIVEYIDVSEEEETLIAMDMESLKKDIKYTHMEIHPSTILGICASIIPFSDHNQCLGHEEKVMMADGTYKMIKDVKIGDFVVTFSPNTLERTITKVVHHYVHQTEKNIYKITLYDDKTIIATYDHRFYTDKGFERVQFFDESTRIGTDVNGETKFIQIKSIEPYTECNIIADITVESENHSFIASGILSSNSPRNIYQSLHPDTTVLMADGTQKFIKNVKIGDSVVVFDHETLNRTYSKVIQQYVKETENKMYKITAADNEIIATDNHSFFTSKGFVEVKDFTKSTLLGINFKNNSIFVPIEKIEEYTESNMIADITVEDQEKHDFIANGFLVHNSSMGKQSMGLYCSNFNKRFDTLAHVLHSPQRPLVSTKAMKYIKFNELPAGINVIVAIASYGGYNQEDSIIVNQSAIDRGLFRSSFFRTYVDQEKEIVRVGGLMEQFEMPSKNETKGIQHGNYGKLGSDGIVEPGSRLVENDVIIGKTTPIAASRQELNTLKKFKKRDVSTSMRPNEIGVVESVMLTTNSDGNKYTKIKTRSVRVPEIGDKLACYSPDHDVLTDKGWVSVTELTTEHRVASLVNGDTLEYVYPTEVMSYDYNGKMYNLESNQVSLCVTPNHRLWTGDRNKKYKINRADEIYGKNRKYQKNCDKFVPLEYVSKHGREVITETTFDIYNEFNEMEFSIPLDSWLSLFGIWLAEGCVYFNEEKGSCYVNIATNKERVRNKLDGLNLGPDLYFGYKFIGNPNRGEVDNTVYRITNKKLAKYFVSMEQGKAESKYLPEWVWSLNQEQCRTLFNGMMLGDGHTVDTTERYDTSSVQLADDVQRLALHMGYSANIALKYEAGYQATIKKEGRNGEVITSNFDAWRLGIVKSQNNPVVNKTDQQDSWIDYNNKVYCCTVPSGIIYVRKNGKPVWCGNSLHGQKGTIGMTYRQEDMPFTKDGVVPDIIINPHAIPSRMTIGHLIEAVLSKLCALEGRIGDATPFNGVTAEEIGAGLEKHGFSGDGTEVLYNGETGEPLPAKIFICPTYYQRLKHMVFDKIHARNSGPVTKLTRQPLEGRSKDGGLRFGEMERDCLISHGSSNLLKDRLFYNSDPYRIHVCKLCGMICQSDLDKQQFLCKCVKGGNTTDIAQVFIPYACKLFFQELMAMSIAPRIRM